MYGLLLGALQHFVDSSHGPDIWMKALEMANINFQSFNTRTVYAEALIPRVLSALSEILQQPEDDIMYENGMFFVEFLSQCGYDKILRVLGRDFVDFIQGLDNLHEYLRFSYPKIKPPSFNVESVIGTTIKLNYRTRRHGFHHYVRGQLVNIAKYFYNKNIKIYLLHKEDDCALTHYMYDIHLDSNDVMKRDEIAMYYENFPIRRDMFFEIFPFHLVLTNELIIQHCGVGFKYICPTLLNSNFNDDFIISKPFIESNYNKIVRYSNSNFEIILKPEAGKRKKSHKDKTVAKHPTTSIKEPMKFKGQMMEISIWNGLLFIGTPIIRDVKHMQDAGLYLNDLNKFDNGKDMVLAGSQQSDELMELLEKQLEKSKKLEDSMKELNKFRKKTDKLLYRCIPKTIAKRLRQGVSAMDTCQVFQSVSICFSKVVDFAGICSNITVDKIVDLLNDMYTGFDNLTESYKVYKVETINDSYMLVSGAPTSSNLHSAHIAEMGLNMIKFSMTSLKNPAKSDECIELLIGCHTGMIVAGIVGIKMPRYCLFGDTVNTASRMMSHGLPNRLHVSDKYFEHISAFPYQYTVRGEMDIKGKGKMITYFIESPNNDAEYQQFRQKLEDDRLYQDDISDDSISLSSRISSSFDNSDMMKSKKMDDVENINGTNKRSSIDKESTFYNEREEEDMVSLNSRVRSESKSSDSDTLIQNEVIDDIYLKENNRKMSMEQIQMKIEAFKLIEDKKKQGIMKQKNVMESTHQMLEKKSVPESCNSELKLIKDNCQTNAITENGNVHSEITKTSSTKPITNIKFVSPTLSNSNSSAGKESVDSIATKISISERTIEDYFNETEINNINSANRNHRIPFLNHLDQYLIKGLTIIANQRPADPIESLALWLKTNVTCDTRDAV